MPLGEIILETISDLLRSKRSFILSTSAPDGDSVGSMLALKHLLDTIGKKSYLYIEDPESLFLKFLPGVDNISSEFPKEKADCLIVVDTGHSSRFFGEKEQLWRSLSDIVINIDHHRSCDEFGDINLLDASASSVGEILISLFKTGNFNITYPMAVSLLTSIIADTGGLKYSNVTSRTLCAAAELIDLGAEIYPITRALYSSKKISSVKLLGYFLSSIKEDYNGKLVWGYLTRLMFEKALATEEEGDKIVEELDVLSDAMIYCLFKESQDGTIKISLRSRDNLSVKSIAEQFGGGGHVQAAGCKLDGPIDVAETKMLSAIRNEMGNLL